VGDRAVEGDPHLGLAALRGEGHHPQLEGLALVEPGWRAHGAHPQLPPRRRGHGQHVDGDARRHGARGRCEGVAPVARPVAEEGDAGGGVVGSFGERTIDRGREVGAVAVDGNLHGRRRNGPLMERLPGGGSGAVDHAAEAVSVAHPGGGLALEAGDAGLGVGEALHGAGAIDGHDDREAVDAVAPARSGEGREGRDAREEEQRVGEASGAAHEGLDGLRGVVSARRSAIQARAARRAR
jgi:hypothetical protein